MSGSAVAQNEKHFLNSTFRERVVEHLFVGEVLKSLWQRKRFDAEVLRPEFDRGGYDVAISVGASLRFIQLKTSLMDGKTNKVKVSLSLIAKPNACVIWIVIDNDLNIVGYRWFGAALGEAFPEITEKKVAKHTKGDKNGVKAERPNHRIFRKSDFETVGNLDGIIDRLFQSDN